MAIKKLKNSGTKKIAVNKNRKVEKEVEVPISKKRDVQDGVTSKGKMSNNVPEGKVTIGTQIGVTLNMGDFQSARIDVFMQRNVDDDPEAIEEGYQEISDILHAEVQRQSELLE